MDIGFKFNFVNIASNIKEILKQRYYLYKEFESYKYKKVIKTPKIIQEIDLDKKNIFRQKYSEEIWQYICFHGTGHRNSRALLPCQAKIHSDRNRSP